MYNQMFSGAYMINIRPLCLQVLCKGRLMYQGLCFTHCNNVPVHVYVFVYVYVYVYVSVMSLVQCTKDTPTGSHFSGNKLNILHHWHNEQIYVCTHPHPHTHPHTHTHTHTHIPVPKGSSSCDIVMEIPSCKDTWKINTKLSHKLEQLLHSSGSLEHSKSRTGSLARAHFSF